LGAVVQIRVTTLKTLKNISVLVCDESFHVRRLVTDVLGSAGIERVHQSATGDDLLRAVAELHPRIIITSSRIPGVSGLEFARRIRKGISNVPRETSIIVMTDTPTQKFLSAAREAGVDEMLVRPFNGTALLARVEAVLLRPRRFVESVNYVGPCRRRRMIEDYEGPLRRFTDPLADVGAEPWEAETNRELVRLCVKRISELSTDLSPGDRRKLREIYSAVRDTEQLADEVTDQAMGDAARSLGRYIQAIGGSGVVDPEVLTTHIDAMQKLGVMGAAILAEREQLVRGLIAVVDKRLGRKQDEFAAA